MDQRTKGSSRILHAECAVRRTVLTGTLKVIGGGRSILVAVSLSADERRFAAADAPAASRNTGKIVIKTDRAQHPRRAAASRGVGTPRLARYNRRPSGHRVQSNGSVVLPGPAYERYIAEAARTHGSIPASFRCGPRESGGTSMLFRLWRGGSCRSWPPPQSSGVSDVFDARRNYGGKRYLASADTCDGDWI